MSSRDEIVPYRLTLFDFPKTEAAATLRHYSAPDRALRALQWGGVLLGLAVLSVFIPIAHFVLVPGFLIAAIAFAIRRLGQTRRIVRVQGRCPRCAVDQEFELDRVPPEGEIEMTCVNCRNRVRGERMDGAAAA